MRRRRQHFGRSNVRESGGLGRGRCLCPQTHGSSSTMAAGRHPGARGGSGRCERFVRWLELLGARLELRFLRGAAAISNPAPSPSAQPAHHRRRRRRSNPCSLPERQLRDLGTGPAERLPEGAAVHHSHLPTDQPRSNYQGTGAQWKSGSPPALSGPTPVCFRLVALVLP